MSTQRLRLFYALWPDHATRTALAQLQAHVTGRNTRPQNLHLTLAFLGEQPASVLPQLQTILRQLTLTAPILTLDQFGHFANSHIAWAGMQAVPAALLQLQQTLRQQLLQHAVCFDQRTAFKPHITLARHAAAPAECSFTPIIWRASEVVLVQSETDGEGSLYRVLGSHRLEHAQ